MYVMQWLNNIVDEAIKRQPQGEILVSSGASPSGTYHIGHLRELITSDAIVRELQKRGRQARHIHYVDDLDALRKIPINIPSEYEKYLGMPLCDIPAPDGSDRPYSNYFLDPFIDSIKAIGIDLEVVYSHQNYRSGFMAPAIEQSLHNLPAARKALQDVSGRKLDEHWSPIQIMENGRLKNRKFISIDTDHKTLQYEDATASTQTINYDAGDVKLDWRLDWPGRWWLLNVIVEPFGRDHATKGGSYDTGVAIANDVYRSTPPIPVPYDFVNRTGDTKKMSASKGTGVHAHETVQALPPEAIRYFMLRYAPSKRLFFDENDSLVRLVDDFANLLAKSDRTDSEDQLVYLCTSGLQRKTVSKVPFSHLVACYQSSLKNTDKTLDIIKRTEYKDIADIDTETIKNELVFIDGWLKIWAPDDVKLDLLEHANKDDFSNDEIAFFEMLANKIETAPDNADGEWFHLAIYDLKDAQDLSPKEMFSALYRLLIGKTSGPRAGWFLSILPRQWLINQLRFSK